MARYTIKNLKAIEDQAPKYGVSPDLEFRVAGGPIEAEELALSYLRVAPGFRLPFGHTHERQEEVYVVVGGSGRIKLDDEIVELNQWDVVRIANDAVRNLEAGPDGAELILIGAPRTQPNDAQVIQNWWSE